MHINFFCLSQIKYGLNSNTKLINKKLALPIQRETNKKQKGMYYNRLFLVYSVHSV